jgi:uncharacterized protein (DUF2384 family)
MNTTAAKPGFNKDELKHYALEVFGSTRKSLSWLDTPSPALSGIKPGALLESGNQEDLARVQDELERIDHGDF